MSDQTRLNVNQAAEFLGCSASLIRNLARSKKLRHTRLGSRYFFDAVDLRDYATPVEPHFNDTTAIE